ncbi:unnamed protein product [Urochloa decumbens]|uniref:RNase H type-1 domain-containing protein n=1 Tax=Urochloa decumbens TaxID=240449 RepID=A0ABC8WEC6_9POAL
MVVWSVLVTIACPTLSLVQLLCRMQPFVMAYTDAALPPDGQGNTSRVAGLGVVLDLGASTHSCCLEIFAETTVESMITGELAARLVAAKIADALHIQPFVLASDCLLAVQHLHKGSWLAPWRLQPWISQFQLLKSAHIFQVIKISRQNDAAHCLAVQAKSVSHHSSCSFFCSRNDHVQIYAVLSALQSVPWTSS